MTPSNKPIKITIEQKIKQMFPKDNLDKFELSKPLYKYKGNPNFETWTKDELEEIFTINRMYL